MSEDDASEIMIEYVERLRVGDERGADVIADAAVAAGCERSVFDIVKRAMQAVAGGDIATAVEAVHAIDKLRAEAGCDDEDTARGAELGRRLGARWIGTRGSA